MLNFAFLLLVPACSERHRDASALQNKSKLPIQQQREGFVVEGGSIIITNNALFFAVGEEK